jgi:hypothetical protein
VTHGPVLRGGTLPGDRLGRVRRHLPTAILVVGVLLRAQLYFLDRAFWRDELMLALGLRDLDWAALLGSLPHHQKAPALYLLVNKLILEIAGPSENGLRLLSFAFSIGALFLFAGVVHRSFGTVGRTVALLALATSDWAIRYAAEAKPYGVDLGVATLALWIVRGVCDSPRGASVWRLAGLAVTAALCTAISFPGAFVFCAAALALTLAPPRTPGTGGRAAGVALGLGASAAAGALYVLVYRPMVSDPYLVLYFETALAPVPWPPGQAVWYVKTATQFFHAPMGMLHVYGAGLLVALVGWVSALRGENRTVALFVGFTAALTTVASLFMNYPLSGRLLLFLVPLATWLFGAACDLRSSDALTRAWVLVASVFVLAPGVLLAAKGVARPLVLEDPRPLLAQLRSHVQRGDVVYLHEFAFPAFHWYAPDLADPHAGLRVVEAPFGEPEYHEAKILRERLGPTLAGNPRVWLLDADGTFSHRWFLEELGHVRADAPVLTSLSFRGTLWDTRPVSR